jgi:multisubunit Na+/H+ antiporter MnhB subunit
MTAFFRTWTFWIALGSWAVLVGGHYAAIVPSPYGLVLANVVAMIYATTRCLQKRKAGIPWKGILLTSEFAFSAMTVLINFCESLTKLPGLSPRALAAISALVVGLGSLMHTLSSSKNALPAVETIINDLAKNNPATSIDGAPSKVLTEVTTPVVPRPITAETTEQNLVPAPVTWAEYALSDDKGVVIGNFCMIPSWNDMEILSFLVKRGLVAHPEQCSIRVLQKDEKGKKVFQSIDNAGKTLTFVFQKDMGQWRPQ